MANATPTWINTAAPLAKGDVFEWARNPDSPHYVERFEVVSVGESMVQVRRTNVLNTFPVQLADLVEDGLVEVL